MASTGNIRKSQRHKNTASSTPIVQRNNNTTAKVAVQNSEKIRNIGNEETDNVIQVALTQAQESGYALRSKSATMLKAAPLAQEQPSLGSAASFASLNADQHSESDESIANANNYSRIKRLISGKTDPNTRQSKRQNTQNIQNPAQALVPSDLSDTDCLSAGRAFWNNVSSDKQVVPLLASSFDIPLQVAHILNSRGIDLETAEHFLSPKLKHEMPDPYVLADMEKAVKIVGNAVLNKQKIGVFGDYDVDGGTSSAIMYRLFKQLNTQCFVHIPDRMSEGYGPNIDAFLKLQNMGADILITVDCGSSAPHVMQQAKAHGLRTVIIDHHLTAGETEGAEATVNPNRSDDTSGLGDLAAAGVSFLFSTGLVRFLRQQNHFNDTIPEPDLMPLLDLVALGTVCDVVPLRGLNRAFVSQGLKVLEKSQNLGLRHLSSVAKVKDKISAYHCGFVYGPRINAGGRVGRASAGFELLTTECDETAKKLATELDGYNLERKAIEDQVKSDVIKQIADKNLTNDTVIIAHGHHWHPGVVGIVASRIKDMFNAPCFILGGDSENENIFKGSGRSIPGVNIGEAVKQAATENIIIAGGGHKAAAGLSVDVNNIEKLRTFFNNTLWGDTVEHGGYKTTKIDAILSPQAANPHLLNALDKLAPFGMGNPTPTFCLENLKINDVQTMGDKHIRLRLADSNNNTLKAVCFNCIENNNPIGQILMNKNNIIDIVGSLKHDTYRNNGSVQFIIDDCRISK